MGKSWIVHYRCHCGQKEKHEFQNGAAIAMPGPPHCRKCDCQTAPLTGSFSRPVQDVTRCYLLPQNETLKLEHERYQEAFLARVLESEVSVSARSMRIPMKLFP